MKLPYNGRKTYKSKKRLFLWIAKCRLNFWAVQILTVSTSEPFKFWL